MLFIRKIDYHCQYALGIIMLVSIPVLLWYGFMAGLFIIGCWQLFSASFNTTGFLHASMAKQIGTYWKWTGIIMAILFLCYPLSIVFDPDDVQVLGVLAIVASIPVAYYYLVIYRKLIEGLTFRNELDGIIKSNH